MTGRSFLACLLVALMTGLLLFGFSVSSPRAEGLVPDRPQCGGDAGDQIYIAIAHDVFRLPYATVEQVRALPSSDDENPIPAPPDPLVPKGCYANPVRAKSLRLNIDILSVLPNAGLPNATIPYVGLAVMPSTVSWQEAHEDWFGMVCRLNDQPAIANMIPEGFVRCTIRTGQMPPNDRKTVYMVSPDLYATPLGEPLLIRTGLGDLLYGGDSIVDYKLEPDVVIYYQFWIKDLPIQHVLDFDRALRAKIEAARVKDYVWPPD